MTPTPGDWRDFTQNAAIRAVLGVAKVIPYRWRVPFVGWVVSRLIAPLAGWDKRVMRHLEYACPDMPAEEMRRMARAVPDNAGRTLIEIYSGDDFVSRVRNAPLTGPGAEAFLAARAANRPVILVTAHFGNYDATRAALFAQGHPLAAIYRPMRNARFNDHYVRAISKIGEPVFPADKRGILGLLKHLSGGNIIGILVDVHAVRGARLTFFGKRAPTALSAAEWALKYDALMVPVYGIRRENGLDFDIVLDAPIAPSTPEEMTQALNDSLEAHVREHMDQWFWIHRRWGDLSKVKARAPRPE
ncbi:MAG: lysophospholipid acyltransferase family protein [Rhodobacteraceae bacterium]|nr:lysophospholipid acyltransferase family protein [Paracoccaceae bacterium]